MEPNVIRNSIKQQYSSLKWFSEVSEGVGYMPVLGSLTFKLLLSAFLVCLFPFQSSPCC